MLLPGERGRGDGGVGVVEVGVAGVRVGVPAGTAESCGSAGGRRTRLRNIWSAGLYVQRLMCADGGKLWPNLLYYLRCCVSA